MASPAIDRRKKLLQSLTDLLGTASSLGATPVFCPRCGKAMEALNVTFWIYGSDSDWNVSLPVCRCAAPSQTKPQIN